MLIGQLMPRSGQHMDTWFVEFTPDHVEVVAPVHGLIQITLNHNRGHMYMRCLFKTGQPLLQRAHPDRRHSTRLQWVLVFEKIEKIRIVGVNGKDPLDATGKGADQGV